MCIETINSAVIGFIITSIIKLDIILKQGFSKQGEAMDRKQIYIDVLIHKGIYKEENTGRQLYEMDEKELWKLIKGDGKNDGITKRCL